VSVINIKGTGKRKRMPLDKMNKKTRKKKKKGRREERKKNHSLGGGELKGGRRGEG